METSGHLVLQRRLRSLEPTQQALADRLGLQHRVVNSWIRGRHMPTLKHLIRVAEVYGISLDWLVGFENIR
jgi:transcriptional regulator with XRE-family HTH domain